jgi:hypothetical protein
MNIATINNFCFIGYDIRERFFYAPANYFLGKGQVVTGDISLCERYNKNINWHRSGDKNYPLELFPEYKKVADSYDEMSEKDKEKYCIYAFEICKLDISNIKVKVGANNFPLYEWALAKECTFAKKNAFSFRGYDVVDSMGISAVTNCGLSSGDIARFGELSKNSLFEKFNAASMFRDYANREVTEHSPFAIFKIYQM